jgi:hypothetical protein
VRLVLNCHCEACRRRNGTAFSTYCVVAEEAMEITQGADAVTSVSAPSGSSKHFCSRCGTPLFNMNVRYPGRRMVYYGTLSNEAAISPAYNVYCESKLAWVDAVSAIRSFDQAIAR